MRFNLIQCQTCGYYHYPVTLADAKAGVESFNEYFDALSEGDQMKFYGGNKASLDSYRTCSRCGEARFKLVTNFKPESRQVLNPVIFEVVNQ